MEEFVSQHVLQCYRFTMKIKPICNLKMKKKFPKNTVSKSTSLPYFHFYVHIFYKPCSIPKMCECMSKISVKDSMNMFPKKLSIFLWSVIWDKAGMLGINIAMAISLLWASLFIG